MVIKVFLFFILFLSVRKIVVRKLSKRILKKISELD